MDWRWQHFFKSDVVMQQIFTIHLHFHRKGWLSQAVCSKFSRCLPEAAARPLSLSLRPARLAILTGRCQDEEVRKAIAVFQHGNTNSTPWEERNFLWNSSELIYLIYNIYMYIFIYMNNLTSIYIYWGFWSRDALGEDFTDVKFH